METKADDRPRHSTGTASTAAPEASRKLVKPAASMAVCFKAMQQNNELPANANMANNVNAAVRPGGGRVGGAGVSAGNHGGE